MNTKFLFASVAALVIATPAMAQDEAAAPEFKGGARVEARIGIDDVVVSLDDESGSKVGFSYGGEVGYDYVTNSGFVIGAYAGIDGSTTKECTEVFGNDEACLKAGRNITAGVRAGGVVRSGLLYLKGGYSNGRATVAYRDNAAPANNISESGNLDGWHIGAGYELPISANTYAKIEYVFTNYSIDDGDFGVDADLQRHQGLIGFGFRF